MKKIYTTALFAAALSLTACANKSSLTETETEITQTTDTTTVDEFPVEDTAETTETAGAALTVKGTVTAINRGKDGYTASVTAQDGKTYLATISIPNLDDPKQYRSVNVGDMITVTGETFAMGAETGMRVRVLQ